MEAQLDEDSSIAAALTEVSAKVDAAIEKSQALGSYTRRPRVVAVSKTKPLEAILEAYAAGQRDFGENYVRELVEKAADPTTPPDIAWRFIGTLQRNKVKLVTSIKGLVAIETVTSIKLADTVERHVKQQERDTPLDVYVQVNTSGEESKGGISKEECGSLVEHVTQHCPSLRFAGLMTIGEYGRVMLPGEINPDFMQLVECRAKVAAQLGIPISEMELSMGMSGDFEHAIEVGSTNVRVGTTIFGKRDYGAKAVVPT